MGTSGKIVLVAVIAGVLGAVAGLWLNGPGPLLRTEPGQRALQAVAAASAPAPPAGLTVAHRGGPMPAITLPTLDGEPLTLPAAFAGRPILINVWASWCGPCIKEMPELNRYAAAQGANGTQVVGIALDRVDDVRAFLQRVPVAYPIVVDAAGPRDAGVQLGNAKGVLPYSVLIGADGRVIKQKIGPFEDGEIGAWAK
ncbi:redoxin family protein [Lysobacter koreensis]|uniref:Redoxin family protein n=1 Tax=Lysobacter koreensis TaxID=266122 RepID=A0ABW2YNZ0_9GAMM